MSQKHKQRAEAELKNIRRANSYAPDHLIGQVAIAEALLAVNHTLRKIHEQGEPKTSVEVKSGAWGYYAPDHLTGKVPGSRSASSGVAEEGLPRPSRGQDGVCENELP
jgi:hypothetical protein